MNDVRALTCMHSSVANLQKVGAELLYSFPDARSNERCDTVVMLGNGAASPVCADSLLLACFSLEINLLVACFQRTVILLFACF